MYEYDVVTMPREQEKQKKKQSAAPQAPPEQPASGKQLRSNSTVSNDPPTTPPRIRKPTDHFDETQREQEHTGRDAYKTFTLGGSLMCPDGQIYALERKLS